MDTNPDKPDTNAENPQDEVARLKEQVRLLESQLARARLAHAKEVFGRLPLPYSEDQLAQMVVAEEGVPLEDFIGEFEDLARGQKS